MEGYVFIIVVLSLVFIYIRSPKNTREMVNSENLFSKISTLETEIYSLNRKISLLSAKVDQLQVGEKADLKEDNENPS